MGISSACAAQWMVLGGLAADGAFVLFAAGAAVVAADKFCDSGLGAELCGRHAGGEIYVARAREPCAMDRCGAGVCGRCACCRRVRTALRKERANQAQKAREILNGAATPRLPALETFCWLKAAAKRCTLIARPLPWPLRNRCHDRNGDVDAALRCISACRRTAGVLPAVAVLHGGIFSRSSQIAAEQ